MVYPLNLNLFISYTLEKYNKRRCITFPDQLLYIPHTYPGLKDKSPQNSIIKPSSSQGHLIFPEDYYQNQIPKPDFKLETIITNH